MREASRLFGVLGIFFGLILYYIWVALLLFLSFYFFAEESIVESSKVFTVHNSNQVFNWLIGGLIPAFLILGHYVATKEQKDIKSIKILLASFLIWLLFLILISLAGMSVSFELNMAGGYLLMLVMLLWIKISEKSSPCNR